MEQTKHEVQLKMHYVQRHILSSGLERIEWARKLQCDKDGNLIFPNREDELEPVTFEQFVADVIKRARERICDIKFVAVRKADNSMLIKAFSPGDTHVWYLGKEHERFIGAGEEMHWGSFSIKEEVGRDRPADPTEAENALVEIMNTIREYVNTEICGSLEQFEMKAKEEL